MRIRSIKPEFWSSEDIACLPWDARLIFLGLWSYVDDNGVGRDNPRLIVADIFPLEEDHRETLATVSRGLQTLSEAGRITRYTVEGKDYLSITNWIKHQRIDKPNKERYPLATREDAQIREEVTEPSRDPRETPAPGTEEQGNRGTGEEETSSPPVRVITDFDAFWSAYPRKVGKGAAAKAYAKARRNVTAEQLLSAVAVLVRAYRDQDAKFIPHPATWLNAERWSDDPEAIRPTGSTVSPKQQQTNDLFDRMAARAQQAEAERKAIAQ